MEHKSDFQHIYENYHDNIRRYIARLIGESEADDVTQEVFLKVSSALDNFEGKSSLSTWIYRIATNAAIDHIRKAGVNPLENRYGEDADSVPDSQVDDAAVDHDAAIPDRQLIRKEMSACIREIVEGLPENYRTVLILSEFEDFTDCQIAEVLDISLETAKIRLHRARVKLKKELERHCSFYRDDRNELACDRKPLPLLYNRK